MRMREQGLKATGCNCRIRAINAYLKWAGSPHHIPRMKEPQLVLPTFTAPQVKMLLGWKAKGFYQRRLHLLTVTGEGSKQRKVPFSFELRKALFRHTREFCPQPYMLLLGILPARFDVGQSLIGSRVTSSRRARPMRPGSSSRDCPDCVMFSLGLRSVTKAWLIPG